MTRRAPSRQRCFAWAQGLTWALSYAALLPLASGCSCEEDVSTPDAEARDPVTGLTAAEAQEVLVQVGDRKITLGDYVGTLLRMDRFERLRYQTEERQKMLLDEMIEVELLAQEAERRGLDKDPEVQLRLQQAMRDELLRRVEAELPAPEEISEREVRDYYKSHRDEFKEPERRRVLLIQLGSEAKAQKVLEKVQGADGETWGKVAAEYSLESTSAIEVKADEFAGDAGFVSAPGVKRGENLAVPEPVRQAIFEVKKIGDIVSRVIADGEFYYVVRLGGLSPARDRTVSEADRTIRIELRRQKFLEAEKKLEAELRKKYPVKIDAERIKSFQPKVAPATNSPAPKEEKPKPDQPAKEDPKPGNGKPAIEESKPE